MMTDQVGEGGEKKIRCELLVFLQRGRNVLKKNMQHGSRMNTGCACACMFMYVEGRLPITTSNSLRMKHRNSFEEAIILLFDCR